MQAENDKIQEGKGWDNGGESSVHRCREDRNFASYERMQRTNFGDQFAEFRKVSALKELMFHSNSRGWFHSVQISAQKDTENLNKETFPGQNR